MTRIVILGDVGVRTDYHAGDEAMLESLLAELRLRDAALEVVVVSASPADSRARYGTDAVDRIGFDEERTPGRDARESRLASVVLAAQGHRGDLAGDDSAWSVIDAVSAADAVVISGGGNLTTPFAEHVYERAALARLAEVFGRPLVVSGQSLGPELHPRDAELVAGILRSARLVGLRESESFETAKRLVPESEALFETFDDAMFLAGDKPTVSELGVRVPREYVVASFPPHAGPMAPDDHLAAIADLLDRTAAVTGLPVLLLPHQSTPGSTVPDGDVAVHARLTELMSAETVAAPQLTARQIADLTRNAALSVSGRYHPAVFALSAGVPAVTVPVDAYTRQKLEGALAGFGLATACLDPISLTTLDAAALVEAVWAEREVLSTALRDRAAAAEEVSRSWWDAVAAALRSETATPAESAHVVEIAIGDAALRDRIRRRTAILVASEQSVMAARAELARSAASDASGTETNDALRRVNVDLEAQVAELRRRSDALRLAAAAGGLRTGEAGADQTPTAQADAEVERLLLERDALEQQLFERERLVAVQGRRIHELSTRGLADPEELEGAHQAVRILQARVAELEAQVTGLLTSTSWRLSTPIRVVKNPRPYVRKLRGQ